MDTHSRTSPRRTLHRPLLLLIALTATMLSTAVVAEEEEKPAHLLGQCSDADLQQAPFDEWFDSGFEDYSPNPEVVEALSALDLQGMQIDIFFGTWCGDSRREVPHLLKLLDGLEFPEAQRRLIAVDRSDPLHKMSPDGEEKGLEIYRVPTVVVTRRGEELGRLVEHPVVSLERDLLRILTQTPYTPSYASYPVVKSWLVDGLLSDPNVSADGLANQVRELVSSPGELASAGRVLIGRGDVVEGTKVHEINCALHWDDARCHARLAEAQIDTGDLESARKSTLRAMRRNDDPGLVDTLVELIERSVVPETEPVDD